jgi:hypothetical protein
MHVPLCDADTRDHPESPAMTRDLERRLACLEASAEPPQRQRYVWLEKGDPIPEPEPGKQIVIVRWLGDDEEHADKCDEQAAAYRA